MTVWLCLLSIPPFSACQRQVRVRTTVGRSSPWFATRPWSWMAITPSHTSRTVATKLRVLCVLGQAMARLLLHPSLGLAIPAQPAVVTRLFCLVRALAPTICGRRCQPASVVVATLVAGANFGFSDAKLQLVQYRGVRTVVHGAANSSDSK